MSTVRVPVARLPADKVTSHVVAWRPKRPMKWYVVEHERTVAPTSEPNAAEAIDQPPTDANSAVLTTPQIHKPRSHHRDDRRAPARRRSRSFTAPILASPDPADDTYPRHPDMRPIMRALLGNADEVSAIGAW